MTEPAGGLGLYSIGVRGLTVPGLLTRCAEDGIPFLHLRGGRRGHNLMTVSDSGLDVWRTIAQDTVPITMVTADITLDDLLHDDPAISAAAQRHLRHTANAATRLGSRCVRILTGELPALGQLDRAKPLGLDLGLLLELHAPSWWGQAGIQALDALAAAWPEATVLADSAQAQSAIDVYGEPARSAAGEIAGRAVVVHLSDNGTGLAGPGHELVARCARSSASTRPLEVAFEWTGSDRTSAQCLHRYRAALAWWNTFPGEPGESS